MVPETDVTRRASVVLLQSASLFVVSVFFSSPRFSIAAIPLAFVCRYNTCTRVCSFGHPNEIYQEQSYYYYYRGAFCRRGSYS